MTFVNAMKAALMGLALVAGAIDAPAASAATAQSVADVPSIQVDFSDLNINTPEGAKRLYGRIEVAASKVCAPQVDRRELARHAIFEKCFDASVERAVAEVNSTALMAVYQKKKGTVG